MVWIWILWEEINLASKQGLCFLIYFGFTQQMNRQQRNRGKYVMHMKSILVLFLEVLLFMGLIVDNVLHTAWKWLKWTNSDICHDKWFFILVIYCVKAASKKLITREEWEKKLSDVKIRKEDMNKLVMNFLVTEGYVEAAEKFRMESGTERILFINLFIYLFIFGSMSARDCILYPAMIFLIDLQQT